MATPTRDEAIPPAAWIALAVASSMGLVVGLAVTAMNIALPAIERDFDGASRSTLSWGITGYNISVASLMLLGGRLGDRMGRRRLFRGGVAVFSIASVALAAAPTPLLFVTARVGQGVGAAMLSPAALALILPLFPAGRQITAIATWTAVANLGAAVGPSFAAGVTQQLGWRWIFVLPLAVCAAAWSLAPRFLPEGRPAVPPTGRIDVLGAFLGTGAVAALALAIVEGPAWGWASPGVLVAFASGVTALVVFVRRCRRHPEPLLDVELLRRRSVWSANLANVFLAGAGLSVWLIYPLFLVQHWDYSLMRSGIAITPAPVVASVTGLFAGRLAERLGIRRVIAIGSIVPVLGTTWLSWRVDGEPDYLRDFLPGALLFGIGFGMIFSPLAAAAIQGVAHAQLGEANAIFNALRSLAGGLGVAVIVAILGDSPLIPISHFRHAYLAVAIMTLIGWGVVALLSPREARRSADEHELDAATSRAAG